jgi:hypothetical protein
MDLGRDGKTPPEYLTENGLKLLTALVLGDSDTTVLSRYAREDGFDLAKALDELKQHDLLVYRDSGLIGIPRREL